ncbi:unnamed protein product [Albugo candida]|uniref:Uncharacterized protein n=1 Tax=Albugo candida TaxID=65357 RepID=A0A024FW67_9STRA|nr:unnamed protein product [Albugo candida]|eukprot:CCI10899.1 unnamed protein product [Albugo candida]
MTPRSKALGTPTLEIFSDIAFSSDKKDHQSVTGSVVLELSTLYSFCIVQECSAADLLSKLKTRIFTLEALCFASIRVGVVIGSPRTCPTKLTVASECVLAWH